MNTQIVNTSSVHSVENRTKYYKTAAYYASYIAIGYATGIIGPTLPGLAVHTDTALRGISFLFPILSTGHLIGSFLSGHFFDRVKGHPLITSVLLLLMVSMALIPLAPMIGIVMPLFFLAGMATSGVDVGGNTLLIWVHRDRVAPFMVGLHLFFGVGAFIAPMVAGLTMKLSGDIVWAYWIIAVICLPLSVLFPLLKSPEHTSHIASEGSEVQNRLMVLSVSVFLFLHVGTELSYGGWIYSYAVTLNLASETAAAYLTSVYWGSLTLGRLISVLLSLRMKPRSILLADLGGCILAVVLLLAFPYSSRLVWVATFILGFSIAALLPTSLTFAGENMAISGRIMRWFIIGIGVGNMFFPWLVGQLFESQGPRILPLINVTTLILALGLLINMLVRTRLKV
jgi:FHS family Na+ dependent glucose MFS transporter 1